MFAETRKLYPTRALVARAIQNSWCDRSRFDLDVIEAWMTIEDNPAASAEEE